MFGAWEEGTSTWHAKNTENLSKGSGQEVPTNIGAISADNIVSDPRKHYFYGHLLKELRRSFFYRLSRSFLFFCFQFLSLYI
jgi:hypothetical protein